MCGAMTDEDIIAMLAECAGSHNASEDTVRLQQTERGRKIYIYTYMYM